MTRYPKMRREIMASAVGSRPSFLKIGLLASTALLGSVAFANAQTADSGQAGSRELEQVVVTATRQASTVNRVALSISAVTQRGLDEQGIKTVSDLQRQVPALQVTTDRAGAQNFTIRGIIATIGAATTGIYLNDTPLQKRRPGGGANAAPGGPAPPLFDLERVEVLRGPQGTLYGGSSQGGTIRFITPQPSLTTYSGHAAAEVTKVESGGMGYDTGIAFGGPIVTDKIAFRASFLARKNAGFIDVVDPYKNGAMRFEDANSQTTRAFRGAVTFVPNERARATVALYTSRVKDKGGDNQWLLPQPAGKTYTTTATCYDTRTPVTPGTLPGRTTCPAAPLPSFIYQRPAITYGPFDYLSKPYQSFAQRLDPARTALDVYDLTLDYNFDHMSVKSITSYIHDQTHQVTSVDGTILPAQQFTTDAPAANGFLLYAPWPDYNRTAYSRNKRHGVIQELRFSSEANATPFSWVAGIYYSNIIAYSAYWQAGELTRAGMAVFGRPTAVQVFGVPEIDSGVTRNQATKDIELAGFGEANLMITDKLKLTAGVRYSRVQFSYDQIYYGTIVGWTNPFADPQGHTVGNTTESPLTPKFGLQYNLTSNDLIYLNASKGFRAGGVNGAITENLCGAALRNLGLTINDVPNAYGSDAIWSYEAGGKFRLFNGRMQLNSSVFKIDWTQLQLAVPNLGGGCRGGWVQNGGKAVSQGFDFDLQAKLFRALTVNFSAGYTDAKYSEPVALPKPLNGAAQTIIVRKGDTLPIPPWQVAIGARYDFGLAGNRAFVRGDYTFSDNFLRGSAPGVAGFAADTAYNDQIHRVNLRAGVDFGRWDLNLFVNNVFDSKSAYSFSGGRTGCSVATGAACTSFTAYDPFIGTNSGRPREWGARVQVEF